MIGLVNARTSRRRWRRRGALAVLTALVLAACGGGERDLVGLTRDPAPVVDMVEVPDVSRDGEPFRFVAPDGGLLVVFFGYTNCPDVCPTTLSDLRRALTDVRDDGRSDGAGSDPTLIDVVMVSIDPEHDRDAVTEYVQGFVPGAHAVALDEDAQLREIATSFGVSYHVDVRPNGRVDVSHSDTSLFAVDDTGTLVLTWLFGTKPADIAGDLRQLLEAASA